MIEWKDPLAKDLFDKAVALKSGNGNREELGYETTALMAKIIAEERNDGGVVTVRECSETQGAINKKMKRHWAGIYAVVIFIAGSVSLIMTWIRNMFFLTGD